MQLKYWKNINPAVDGMQKISGLTWAPNGKKLAICTAERVIYLFNENGEKKDKFPTKPSEKGQKSYVVRAIEFSPDSQKIAIAQSDNIVFIYKIGLEWGDKKSICNKFPASSSVTCLVWPKDRSNDIVFGLAEGKVKMGLLKNNKSQVLYSPDSYCVSLAASRDGEMIISGHLDGTVYTYHFEKQQYQKILKHHSVPYGIGLGEQIVCGGNDAKISFYDLQGNFMQRFDYTNDDKLREFSLASFNPSGDTVVLGNFNRFYVYQFNKKRTQWEEISVVNVENYYTVTALCWKSDGSKLVTGSLCGSVDIYDASLRKVRYKGKFEFNYVSPSQIVIQTLATGDKVVIKSNVSPEITKINILQDRFVVANTNDTIIVGDIETQKLSELMWRGSGNEKYDFSNPNVCMIFNAGELTLIEFGDNEPLGTCRTEYVKPSLISCRIRYVEEKDKEAKQGSKIIAYLLDQQTICMQNLSNNSTICNISHDSKIDFLELNANANKILFRDKRRQLYMYNLKSQQKNTLLNYCNYCQWVPDSEVVVAQNRNNLCVWYSIENPDKVTIYNIKGDVEEIVRIGGKTEVHVNEGNNLISYQLDEPLIEFGFAIESRDLEKAAAILDPLDMNPETEANWKTLAQIAVEEQDINVAEHCYAAMGDIGKAAYLRKINKMIVAYKVETGRDDGIHHFKVQAKLACLEKQFHQAEAILLDHNEIEEAMEMYQELHKWDESIKIAERKKHPEVKDLKDNYYQWLLQTNQEGKAAEVKENEGDYVQAINLYLQGGLPARAANIVFNYNVSFPQDLLEKIATTLAQSGMYERAGEFYEQMDQLQRGLECYCKGNSYKKAVELAKNSEPRLVTTLEERWGDWLVSQKQTENAVNHYIEANAFQKAIEAAISSRQWAKAVQLVQGQQPEISRPFYRQIAKHYADVRQYDLGEKYYLRAGQPIDAFEMYIKANKWDQALRITRENLPENEIVMLYVKTGQSFEEKQIFKEAERLYTTVKEYDLAINMYKKVQQYDNMIRLVAKFRKELLKDTHLSIAQKYEHEGNLKNAEQHYIESGAWHGAVEMYKNLNQWEDAIRVSKLKGTDRETCELAKKWAETLGPQAGMKMLLKMNLVDAVIEYMIDRGEFDKAFQMANQNAIHKKADVHLKFALFLEDERRYKEAEEHFIKAGKPSEAINMYEHQGDFFSALAVARQQDPQAAPQILINQAKFFMDKRDFQKAENCFIQARKPDYAVQMYLDLNNYHDALRIAKKHVPQRVNEINNKYAKQGTVMSGEDIYNSAKLWEESRDYQRAIDAYLDIKKEHFQNQDILEEAWERAVHLALQYDKDRAADVIRIVCKRLIDISRFEQAAELFENIGLYEEAVGTYIAGKLFERAKVCADQIKNQDMHQKLMGIIQSKLKVHLKETNQATGLVQQGDVQGGLDMLAEKGDWQQCLTIAEKNGKDVLNRYLMRYAKFTMEGGNFADTIAAFAKFGIQAIPQNYPIYKTLTLEIFADCEEEEISNLRKALQVLQQQLELAKDPAEKEFGKYLTIAHFFQLKSVYKKRNIPALSEKLAISLLRYCDLIRLDKVFYDAGLACKENNNMGMAFMLLNRYLDIYEVIEDPDNENLSENNDFAQTDIPSPFNVPFPQKNMVAEQEKEEIRDWCLKISVKQKVQHQLPTRTCEFCQNSIYEPCLKCPMCKNMWEPCVITGYPLLKSKTVNCKSCGKGGIRESWNQYLQFFAHCPWCGQTPNVY